MKKLLSVILVIAMLLTVFSACTKETPPAETPPTDAPAETPAEAPAGEKVKITLWATGSQNVSDLFTKLVDTYNAKPDGKAEVELQFLMSGTGDTQIWDRIAAAYKTNNTGDHFDLIAENSNALQRFVDLAGSEDVFIPLDFSKIPNYENIKVKSSFDNSKVVPYRGTTVVLAYDSARVANPPKTWAELTQWMKDNPGRFAYNPPGTGGAGSGFVGTAIYKDLPKEAKTSNDAKWAAEWDAGFKYLEEIHPYMYQSGGGVVYPNKNQGSIDLLINKEVDIIPAWADQALSNVADGTLPDTVKIYQLEDAPLNGTDVVFAMPSVGSKDEACYDFINYVLTPEAQAICLETIYAVPVIDTSLISSDKINMISDIDISKFETLAVGNLSEELNLRWDEEIATLG